MKKSKDILTIMEKGCIDELYKNGKIPLSKESDILSTDNIDLSDDEKREMAEINTQIILEERNDFKIKFQGLYSKLSNQYNNNIKANPKKLKTLLYGMIEDINTALHNANKKYEIILSEDLDEHIPLLKDLKETFESHLQKLFKPQKKVGRPDSKCMEVNKLINIEDGNVKIKLIEFLKLNYSGCEIDEFYRLIAVLEYKNIIDLDNNKKENQLSFEKFLKPKGYDKVENQEKETIHTYQNFNSRVMENIKSFNVYKFKKGNYYTGINPKKGQAIDKILTDLVNNNPLLPRQ